MPYDKQLIAVVHPTKLPGGQTLIEGAAALQKAKAFKAKQVKDAVVADAVIVDPTDEAVSSGIQAKFAALTQKSRLYLFAHGGGTGGNIGGVGPVKLATFLRSLCGLKKVGKIVLIACGSEAAIGTTKKFHAALGDAGVKTDVYAYLAKIKVIDEKDMELVHKLAEVGVTKLDWKLGERRLMMNKGQDLDDFKKPKAVKLSKYVCAWVNGEQVFDTVY